MKRLRCGLLLVLLFATMLFAAITWQARVIEEQGELIQILRQDSAELQRRRMNEVRQRVMERRMQNWNVPPEPGAGLGCLPRQTCG